MKTNRTLCAHTRRDIPRRMVSTIKTSRGLFVSLTLHDALEADKKHRRHKREDGAHSAYDIHQHEDVFRTLLPVSQVHAEDTGDDAVHRHEERRRGEDELELDELVPLRVELDVDEVLGVVDELVEGLQLGERAVDVREVRLQKILHLLQVLVVAT